MSNILSKLRQSDHMTERYDVRVADVNTGEVSTIFCSSYGVAIAEVEAHEEAGMNVELSGPYFEINFNSREMQVGKLYRFENHIFRFAEMVEVGNKLLVLTASDEMLEINVDYAVYLQCGLLR